MVDRAKNGNADQAKQSGDRAPAADEVSGKKGSAERESMASPANIPRWRQIEIMHERAQLRKLLDDFDLNFEELEVEVFGSEAEHDIFYRQFADVDEEEIEIEDDDEDDDYEDDDYEDLEE